MIEHLASLSASLQTFGQLPEAINFHDTSALDLDASNLDIRDILRDKWCAPFCQALLHQTAINPVLSSICSLRAAQEGVYISHPTYVHRSPITCCQKDFLVKWTHLLVVSFPSQLLMEDPGLLLDFCELSDPVLPILRKQLGGDPNQAALDTTSKV